MDRSSLFAAGIACCAAGLAPVLAAMFGLLTGAAPLFLFAVFFFVTAAKKPEAI